jgi:hypothetical protein
MVQEPASIARYLAALGQATEVPRRSPGRGPPLKSRVLRRQVLGEQPRKAPERAPQACGLTRESPSYYLRSAMSPATRPGLTTAAGLATLERTLVALIVLVGDP